MLEENVRRERDKEKIIALVYAILIGLGLSLIILGIIILAFSSRGYRLPFDDLQYNRYLGSNIGIITGECSIWSI